MEFIYDKERNVKKHIVGCYVFKKKEYRLLNRELKKFKLKVKKDKKRRTGEFEITTLKKLRGNLGKKEKLAILTKRYKSFRVQIDKRFSKAPCHLCKRYFSNIKVCSGCKQIFYCSTECHEKDWVKHEKICKYFKNL